VRFSARLDTRLVDVVRTADVERSSIADIWRVAGETADRLGLCRPGYHSVLRLVRDERERRAARRAAIVEAIDELWSHTGTDYETLVRRLAKTRRG
jgi:hypothetical protein